MQLKKFKEFLTEMSPYLHNHRKDLEELSYIPMTTINKGGYIKLGSIYSNVDVYEIEDSGAIISGQIIDDRFYIYTRIFCEERSLYVKRMQLSDKRKHIKMINTSKEFTRTMSAKQLYIFIVDHFDLISDRIQFIGAKDLWMSVARSNEVNVYVFDENKKDYIRDSNGTIVKYNGRNIDETEIWGQDQEHHDRLLVAVNRKLK